MSSELFSNIQTVRYYLKGKETMSLSFFRRPDISFLRVSSNLAFKMKNAYKSSPKSWEEARNERPEKLN